MRNSVTEDMDEFGKVGAEMSYFQSSDLEDGELRKMLALPLCMQNREDCESSRMPNRSKCEAY